MRTIRVMGLALPILLNACAINRAPSLNLLEKRSDYENVHQVKEALEKVDQPLLVPVRTKPVIADIWVHPHELPNGDYFRGGWVRTVVTRSHWQVEDQHQPLIIKETKKLSRRRDIGGKLD